VYNNVVDVAVTELRAHLSDWLERARAGSEVVITDRGVPVARLVGLQSAATLERLTADGVIGRAAVARRPIAAGHSRPRPRQPVSDLVSEQRR
jgi:prevent-host-death family protein